MKGEMIAFALVLALSTQVQGAPASWNKPAKPVNIENTVAVEVVAPPPAVGLSLSDSPGLREHLLTHTYSSQQQGGAATSGIVGDLVDVTITIELEPAYGSSGIGCIAYVSAGPYDENLMLLAAHASSDIYSATNYTFPMPYRLEADDDIRFTVTGKSAVCKGSAYVRYIEY